MKFTLNGVNLQPYADHSLPFTKEIADGQGGTMQVIDYIQRPSGWLLTATPEELAFHGVVRSEEVMQRPDDTYHYVNQLSNGQYEVIEKPIEQLRALFWERMKVVRQQKLDGGFSFGPFRFDSDSASRSMIMGGALSAQIALLGNTAWSKDWTLEDNSVVTITPEQMIAVGQALDAHIQSIYDRGVQVRQQIQAALVLADLLLISWDVQ